MSARCYVLAWAATLAAQLVHLPYAGQLAGLAILLFLLAEFRNQHRYAQALFLALLGMGMLGVAAAPQQVLANDEPLGAITAPHYLYSTVAPSAIITPQDAGIVVEASVDSTGRVYDFTIVAGPQDEGVRTQVANQLLDSVFQPASAFGVPIRGHAIITFSGISVHG